MHKIERMTEMSAKLKNFRSKVFQEEFPNLKCPAFDPFDWRAFHICITDMKTREIVASVRLRKCEPFYSQESFCIADFLGQNDKLIEVSRFCIAKPHRNTRVIFKMLKCLAMTAREFKASYLFGLSSSKKKIDEDYFQNSISSENYILRDFDCAPIRFEGPNTDTTKELPAILRAYLKIGARVLPSPAYDSIFDCWDYLTVMKTDDIHSKF